MPSHVREALLFLGFVASTAHAKVCADSDYPAGLANTLQPCCAKFYADMSGAGEAACPLPFCIRDSPLVMNGGSGGGSGGSGGGSMEDHTHKDCVDFKSDQTACSTNGGTWTAKCAVPEPEDSDQAAAASGARWSLGLVVVVAPLTMALAH